MGLGEFIECSLVELGGLLTVATVCSKRSVFELILLMVMSTKEKKTGSLTCAV